MWKVFQRVRQEVDYYRALIRHAGTPRVSKWLLVAAVAYFLSPIDLIPDGIPILGQLDDLLIVPGLIYLAIIMIPMHVKTECRASLSRPRS